jgi:hypothetical protein
MQGIRRRDTGDREAGRRKAKEGGKEHITRNLFLEIGQFLLNHSVAAFLFHTLMWNVMCRSRNISKLRLSHMVLHNDAIRVRLHSTKGNQDGEGKSDDPKHIYANPFDPHGCAVGYCSSGV